jgi:hypothetical protein
MSRPPALAVILTLSEVEWGRTPKNSIGPESPNVSAQTFVHSDYLC